MNKNKVNGIFGVPILSDNVVWLWVVNNSVTVIDPGISIPIINWIKSNQLNLEFIFQTHHHFDHIGGTQDLINEWPNVKIIASKKDKKRIPFQNISVEDGTILEIMNKKFEVIELLGHTRAHISFYSNDFPNPILFVGDTLFSGGCGRILEGTNEQMYKSLKKISSLPLNTLIYCAHEYTQSNLSWALEMNPNDELIAKKLKEIEKKSFPDELCIPTTLKEEMNINLFLRAKNLQEFSYLRAKKDAWV